jgi:hypothetical protein
MRSTFGRTEQMIRNARTWRVMVGGLAAGVAGVVGLAGASASAEPVLPQPPLPGPATVTQTVTVAPAASPVAPMQPAASSPSASSIASTGTQPGLAAPTSAAPVAAAVATPPAPTLVPANSGTLADFFKNKGVTQEAQRPQDFRALNITLPMPAGWYQVPDPNVPDAFAVIADRAGGDGLYTSNAQVVVYKLIGAFDPKEAITHGFVDSQQLIAWQSTDASLADFGGFPSSIIEGTYRLNDQTLNTSRRNVIATAGPDKYLVSLAVTTSVSQAVAAANATDSVVNGFRVAAAGAPGAPLPDAAHGQPG